MRRLTKTFKTIYQVLHDKYFSSDLIRSYTKKILPHKILHDKNSAWQKNFIG